MIFNINKDFINEYKDDLYRGLSGREVISIASGGATAFAVGCFAWKQFGISPDTAVYIGMPFAAPFVILPNVRFQGYMTVTELFREMLYTHFCTELSVDGIVENEIAASKRVFCMDRSREGSLQRWKRHRENEQKEREAEWRPESNKRRGEIAISFRDRKRGEETWAS